jgi:hypothetical protein
MQELTAVRKYAHKLQKLRRKFKRDELFGEAGLREAIASLQTFAFHLATFTAGGDVTDAEMKAATKAARKVKSRKR